MLADKEVTLPNIRIERLHLARLGEPNRNMIVQRRRQISRLDRRPQLRLFLNDIR